MTIPVQVELGAREKDGVYGDYYSVVGHPDLIGKMAQPLRTKRYLGKWAIRYPMNWYTTVKFGIPDIIRHEYNVYKSFPAELAPYLPRRVSLTRTPVGQTVLCFERVRDYDGALSKALFEMGPVGNPSFWEGVSRITHVLRNRRICLLWVFKGDYSVYVQRVSDQEWRPVLTDVTKSGKRMCYYKIYTLFDSLLWWKFDEDLRRFRMRYMSG